MMGQENIEDYALIGDCHGCALISRHGSVDWLSLKRFDADPLMWKILDQDSGAYLDLELEGQWQWTRRYLDNTNILITEATNVETVIRIIDFMPVGRCEGSKIHDYTSLMALHVLVRKIEVEGSAINLKIRINKSRWPDAFEETHFYVGYEAISEMADDVFNCKLNSQRPLHLMISNERGLSTTHFRLKKFFEVTKSFWEDWIAYSLYRGPHEKLIARSALALKLLIYAPSGAIIAAATTSLPEAIGGERNWDYRYCWLRDATFTLYALSYLGFSGEADKFAGYLQSVVQNTPGPMSVLYTLDGKPDVPESLIEGVAGFMGSSPVRVGNDAYKQRQLDTFGEFLDWAYLHRQLGGTLTKDIIEKIEETAELVRSIWKDKDLGIWEVRSAPEDFTHSKIMCWVALDRAESLLGTPEKYHQDKSGIEAFIRMNCLFEGRLKRSAQNSTLDASLLLTKIVGFPIEDEIYEKTVNAVMEELSSGMFVKRYKTEDGLSGPEEGEFLTCSFWAVNAYLFLGKETKARELFEKLVTCFNDVGLMSEEYDARSGHFLGNFPQALSHLAFIETASYFDLYARGGKEALRGCHGDRVRKLHATLHGPRAVWDYLIKTKNFRKIFPSWASIMRIQKV